MKEIRELLAEHPFFEGLELHDLDYIAGCAHNDAFKAGQTIFREGEPANSFYIIRQGDVTLVTRAGPRGPLAVQTLHDGDVLGWSWLIPPYQWQFEARANDATRVTVFDGACLRGKCEATPRLGYELMKRFAAEMVRRFSQTRLQLLDVYGAQSDGG